ncbi:MAG: Quinolinate synthetase, partial [uncultured Solirubrobacteraceae bacterium]
APRRHRPGRPRADRHPQAAGRDPRARPGARRGDPRPQLPSARGPGRRPLRRRLARPQRPGRQGRGRGHRLLRRALHGRERVDPQPREDRPHPGPRRRLLAGRLDHARPAEGLAGQAPGRDHRHVRQHDGRDQGAHRLLRDLLERGGRRAAHPRHAGAGHGDPLRPRHVPRGVRREGARGQAARLGRRVPRARGHPAERHRPDPRGAPW